MPLFEIQEPGTGRIVTVEADREPTQEEAAGVLASLAAPAVEGPGEWGDMSSPLTMTTEAPPQDRLSSGLNTFMQQGGQMAGQFIQGVRRARQMVDAGIEGQNGDQFRVPMLRAALAVQSGATQDEVDHEYAAAMQAKLAQDPFYQFGGNLSAGAAEAFPSNPAYRGEFLADTLAGAAGALPLTIATAGPVGAGVLHGVSAGEQAAQQAEAAGVPENANLAFLLTAPITGVSEAVLGRAGRVLPGLSGEAAPLIQRAGLGAVKEGTQEGIEQLGQNTVVQQFVDPSQTITEGVAEGMAAGGILGAGLDAMQGMARVEDLPLDQQTVLSTPEAASTDIGNLPVSAPAPVITDLQAEEISAALDAPEAVVKTISEPLTAKEVIPSGQIQEEGQILQGQDEVLTETAAVDETRPGSEAVTPFLQRVLEAEAGSLTSIFEESGHSLTSKAYELGGQTDTQAKLDDLLAHREKAIERFKAAMSSGQFDQAFNESAKSQFFREAAEYATGTASAGAWQKNTMPNYQPPMAAEATKKTVVKGMRDLADYLEDWKLSGDGNVYSTLLPGFDPATFKAVWNTAITAVQAALRSNTATTLAEAIQAGLAVLRESAGEGYDEAKATDALMTAVQVGTPPTFGGPLQHREFIGTSSSSLGRYEYLRQTEAGRATYAKEFADFYDKPENGGTRGAMLELQKVGDPSFQAVIRAEITARVAQKIYQPGAPEYLETVRQLQQLAPEVLMGKSEAGQRLQAEAQVNRRLQSSVPLLTWLGLLQKRQQQVVDAKVPPTARAGILTGIGESGTQASNDIARGVDPNAPNPPWMGSNASIQKLLRSTMVKAGLNWRDLFTALPEVQAQRMTEITKRITDLPQFAKLTPEQKAGLAAVLDEAWQRQRDAIFRAEFKRLVPLPEVTAEAKSQIEDAIPELFRQANLGLLDELSFRDALARKMGLEGLDGPTAKKLAKIGQEAERAPEGVIRNKIFERGKHLIEDSTSINPYELLKSGWYANVLSGLATGFTIGTGSALIGLPMIAIAAVDAAVTQASPMMALRILGSFFKTLPEGAVNFFDVVTSGDYTRFPEYQRKFQENLEGRFRPEELEKLWRAGGLKSIPGSLGIVSRVLTGLDQWASLGVRDAGTIYAALSRKDQESLGELMKKFDGAETKRAKEQARKELEALGMKPKIGDIWTRQREILEQGVARDITEAGIELGMIANLNRHPTGILGKAYDWLTMVPFVIRAVAGLTFLRGMFNLANEYANWTPVGLISYGRSIPALSAAAKRASESNKYLSWMQALAPEVPTEERRLILAKTAFGTLATYLVAQAFLGKDHDDDEWEITGGFRGFTPKQIRALQDYGIKPNSIWRRNPDNGKVTSFSWAQWPMAGGFAMVGNMRDQELYRGKKWDDEETVLKLANGAAMGFTFLSDLSFMDQIGRLTGQSVAARGSLPEEEMSSWARKGAQAIAGITGGAVPFSGLLKDIDTWDDPKIYRPDPKDAPGILLRSLPFARRLSADRPTIDIFGEPLEYTRKPWSRLVSDVRTDPEMAILSAKAVQGVWPTRPTDQSPVVDSTGTRRQMTEPEFWDYQQAYGQIFKAIVHNNADKILALQPEAKLLEKIKNSDAYKQHEARATPEQRILREEEINTYLNQNSAEAWFRGVHGAISKKLKESILYGPEKKQ